MNILIHPTLLLLFLLLSCNIASGQGKLAGIMFYNVENLFDTKDDPETEDDEFTPQGARRWTYSRLREKHSNIARVIINSGQWELPVIVGLCEVENGGVLHGLLHETGLFELGYRFVHHDSPDRRGIDVALLYRRDGFEVLTSFPIEVALENGQRPTRDILYVKGVLDSSDTLHVLVNHWPSRRGGVATTQANRRRAAIVLNNAVDSIKNANQNALVILMGDFNEPPRSDIFRYDLKAGSLEDETWLINLALSIPKGKGTLKFRHAWYVLDQMIVSRPFFEQSSGIFLADPVMRIVDLSFLKERDELFGGQRPSRTYRGYRYTGGYSDHFPVWIDLLSRE